MKSSKSTVGVWLIGVGLIVVTYFKIAYNGQTTTANLSFGGTNLIKVTSLDVTTQNYGIEAGIALMIIGAVLIITSRAQKA